MDIRSLESCALDDRDRTGILDGMAMALIVAGFHRSGTSMASEWLERAGVDFGHRLMPAGASNPRGHFEDLDIVEIHDEILASRGDSWRFRGSRGLEVDEDHLRRMRSIADTRARSGLQWGFKDPRVCLFLDAWLEVIPDAHFIIVYRHWSECISSLQRREAENLCLYPKAGDIDPLAFWREPDLAASMWLGHNRCLLDFQRRHPESCTVISSSSLMSGASLGEILERRIIIGLDGDVPSPYDPDLARASGRRKIPAVAAPDADALDLVWTSLNAVASEPGVAPEFEWIDERDWGEAHAELLGFIGEHVDAIPSSRPPPPPLPSVSLETEDMRILVGAARARLELGEELDRAVESMLEVVRREETPSHLLMLAHAQNLCDQTEAARESYERTLRLEPDHPVALRGLAQLARLRSEHEVALEYARSSLTSGVEPESAYMTMGTIHLDMGESKSAWECFDKALEARPDHVAALHGLVQARPSSPAEERELRERLDDYVERHPGEFEPLQLLSQFLYREGKAAEGRHYHHLSLCSERSLLAVVESSASWMQSLSDPRSRRELLRQVHSILETASLSTKSESSATS